MNGELLLQTLTNFQINESTNYFFMSNKEKCMPDSAFRLDELS